MDIRELIGKPQEAKIGMQPPPTGIPEGWRQIKSAAVYEKGGRIFITATPDEAYPGFEDNDDGHPHNCDAEGCGWEHVVGDGNLRRVGHNQEYGE